MRWEESHSHHKRPTWWYVVVHLHSHILGGTTKIKLNSAQLKLELGLSLAIMHEIQIMEYYANNQLYGIQWKWRTLGGGLCICTFTCICTCTYICTSTCICICTYVMHRYEIQNLLPLFLISIPMQAVLDKTRWGWVHIKYWLEVVRAYFSETFIFLFRNLNILSYTISNWSKPSACAARVMLQTECPANQMTKKISFSFSQPPTPFWPLW